MCTMCMYGGVGGRGRSWWAEQAILPHSSYYAGRNVDMRCPLQKGSQETLQSQSRARTNIVSLSST